MLTKIRFVLLVILAIILSNACPFVREVQAQNKFDTFAALSPEKQKEELVKIFRERMEKLTNLYYQMDSKISFYEKADKEEIKDIEKLGKFQNFLYFRFSHWLYKNTYRMQIESCKPDSEEPSQWLDNAYDGSEGINRGTVRLSSNKDRILARIDTRQDSPIALNFYWCWLTDKFYRVLTSIS
jgi:hypothetical protein